MDWNKLKKTICSLDIETNENGDIFAFAAIYQDQTFQQQAPFNIKQLLTEFDSFAQNADYILGHNIIAHDLPICRALTPRLSVFTKPVIDTLLLSPLAFPENPYHRLVKNYKLVRDSLNDPLADAQLAMVLFEDQWHSLQEQQIEFGLAAFYQHAFSVHSRYTGLQQVLLAMGAVPIDTETAFALFKSRTQGNVCQSAVDKVVPFYLYNLDHRPALAYCLAWLRVAGGNSVLPEWVRHQFDDIVPALRQLRDISCQSEDLFLLPGNS